MDFSLPKDVYPVGRLDKDSEGLLLLSNDGPFIHRVTSPQYEKSKVYFVQVEGIPTHDSLFQFSQGLKIENYHTLPCEVEFASEFPFTLWERTPPIRQRKSIPTCWLKVCLHEGKNRQIRKMTAHIGHPTLRLIRYSILNLTLDLVPLPGQWKEIPLSAIDL